MKALVLICAALLAGCASTRVDNTQARERIVTVKQVPIVTPDGAVNVITTTETASRDLISGTTSEYHGTVDAPAVLEVAKTVVVAGAKVASFAGMPDITAIGTVLLALAGTAAAAYKARGGEVKQLKDENEYHKRDAAEGWEKADERALMLPAKQSS